MSRLLRVVAATGVLCALAAPVGAAQSLAIALDADDARATSRVSYDPAHPIDVRLTVRGRAPRAVVIVAGGPAGERIEVPLTRAGAAFVGRLTLADPGSWTLRIATRRSGEPVTSAPIPVAVTLPTASDAWLAGVGAGTAVFALLGGGGLWALTTRRRR